jgi:hypothetical protein
MNEQQQILVQRLIEGELSTQRFLKVGKPGCEPDKDKAAFELEWEKRLYAPEDLDSFPRWGICGKDYLVLIDSDKRELYDYLNKVLPNTFEVTSPRHGIPHKYLIVCGEQVPNGVFHIPGDLDEKGRKNKCGEVRAENQYLVAPGTTIRYKDLKSGEWKTGQYIVTNNVPIARMEHADFMAAIKPYMNPEDDSQRLTAEDIEHGVSTGERHYKACLYADHLIGHAKLDAETTLFELRRWDKLNNPPINDDEYLKRCVRDALRFLSKKIGISKEQLAIHGAIANPVKAEVKKKVKQLHADSGETENGCFEAIYDKGEPRFLVTNDGHFSIVEKLEVNGKDHYPRQLQSIPYKPYEYYDGPTPTKEELYSLVRKECQTWIDVEPVWLDVIAACIMLTYQQQKTQTTPYLYLYGDNESGKTSVHLVLNALCYRPLFGVTIPSADIYGYLEDTNGSGCILEDEIQGIDEDTDKIKIYKAGYKQGSVVPRMLMTENDRIIKYYRVFCFKAVNAERISTVKGFNERFIFIPMVEGTPEKEWVDLSREDTERHENIRNKLLKWRMQTRTEDLPNISLTMKGRIKELWKPILQITSGLKDYSTLSAFVEEQQKERLSIRQDTLEGKIVKVIVEIYEKKGDLDEVHFSDIWKCLTDELKGKINDAKPNVMDTADFYEVTKNKVGYRLREVLSGKAKTVRAKVEGVKDSDQGTARAYWFETEKVKRIAKKYGYPIEMKL